MADQPSVLEQMAAALDGHQITDDRGNVTEGEEPSEETTAAPEEKTPVEETPTAEKPADSDEAPSQEAKSDDENELGVDDAGKRYVPEKRFKDVYGKYKATERELDALRAKATEVPAPKQSATKASKTPETQNAVPDKADVLELKMTLPQFDPKTDENGTPTNPDYSPELDELGFRIWKSDPNLSLVDAGKMAIQYAKKLAHDTARVKEEAKLVKSIQSDQGITGRGGQRPAGTPDVDNMSDQEMEAYLKANGQW